MKKALKILNETIIIIFGTMISLVSYEYISNIKYEKKIISILNASIQSIEKKELELSLLNMTPIFFDYKASDTLLVHKKNIDFEYDIFYDRLLNSEDMNLKMDSKFYVQILSFKIRHKELINRYISKDNDSLRDKIKKNIVLQILEEKEILKGEIDYLENKISKDSLSVIRNETFRKYINFDI